MNCPRLPFAFGRLLDVQFVEFDDLLYTFRFPTESSTETNISPSSRIAISMSDCWSVRLVIESNVVLLWSKFQTDKVELLPSESISAVIISPF